MNATQALKELERMGTAQNRKVYSRHGITAPMFGVSYANLYALRKKIGRDQPLAEALWASGNHDARVLATMVADPAKCSPRLLNAWAKDLDCYAVTDAFVALVYQTPHAQAKMGQWLKARDVWRARAGWHLLGQSAAKGDDLPDSTFTAPLQVIEREIHQRPNRVREAMNNALIAIGSRNQALAQKALASAARIGPVTVDHGETYCKTPDAAARIRKAQAKLAAAK